MLTTLGSSCLEICENWLESTWGEGTVNGVASEGDDFLSWPLTPEEITVPIRIPTVNVIKIEMLYARRFAFKRTQRALTR
jgi:hypothetical protein